MPPKLPRRLDKLLADARFGPRSAIERAVAAGRVTVEGVVVRRCQTLVAPATEAVEVDGVRMRPRPAAHWLLWHKPLGVVTTMAPLDGKDSLRDVLPTALLDACVAPVGRLDKLTSGAMLLTDDGDLAYLLLHPRHAVFKRYRVGLRLGSVRRREGVPAPAPLVPDDPRLLALRDGVDLDGTLTRLAEVALVDLALRDDGPDRVQDLTLSIAEGRHHQVRRMISAVGLRLKHLHREAIGPLELGDLAPGGLRHLDAHELDALYAAAGGRDAPARCAVAALERRLTFPDLDPRERALIVSFLS